MKDLMKTWKRSLELIRGEIPDVSFETWISSLVPLQLVDNTMVLKAQTSLGLGFVKDRYDTLIRNALHYTDPSITGVLFVLSADEIPVKASPKEEKKNEPEWNVDAAGTINPKYTFDRFVIGENNRFAHAASVAVAESPSKKYNPLFIYGGVGLGKTHLMQAIGNYVLDEKADRRVVYVSCEDFTNEFINSIQNNKSNEFRMKYRSTDILLIDDIQFLAGKVETQEAFFHTFNTLHEANKQIVISSDRQPKEIPKLEDRLRSRFEMGLITDISAPNFETRMAILLKKSESYDMAIPEEILSYIAENIHSNIRELEGALTTVTAYANLHGKPLSLALAREALKDLLHNQVHKIDIPYIKKITAQFFDVTPEELDSKKRTKKVTQPRQVAMYLSRELTDASFPKIGEMFGGRDHSTVVHACQKITEDIKKQEEFSNLVEMIRNEIVGSQQ